MKFSLCAVLFVSSLSAGGVDGFSAVVPPKSPSATNNGAAKSAAGAAAQAPVDRSMRGMDDDATFDPTGGRNPALTRNNKDEVWVSQVCFLYGCDPLAF